MKKKEAREVYLKSAKKSWWYETLAAEDPEFLEDVINLLSTQQARERPGGLPLGTKHLIWLVVECALKIDPTAIKGHMEAALNNGYTPQQIIEALEVAVPPTGYPSFTYGLRIWKEVMKERKK